jgi:hypothetical protein
MLPKGFYNTHQKDARPTTIDVNCVTPKSFDPGWEVCEGDVTVVQALYSQCSSESSHFIANEFSNGWIINETGSFEFSVVFRPDGVYQVGLFASISIMITLIWYICSQYELESSLRSVYDRFLKRKMLNP